MLAKYFTKAEKEEEWSNMIGQEEQRSKYSRSTLGRRWL